MVETELSTPEMTFEEAIALTQTLLDQVKQAQISDLELQEAIALLVGTENGARGFFVTYLSDPRSPADHPSAGVIAGLQTSPEIVSELLVKNLAMSAAMAITHRRNGSEEMAKGSDRVRSRTTQLIHQLDSAEVAIRARQLHESTITGEGEYQGFLKRWGYDAEQRQVIQQAIEAVLDPDDLGKPGDNPAAE
jgi:hypothetical protein